MAELNSWAQQLSETVPGNGILLILTGRLFRMSLMLRKSKAAQYFCRVMCITELPDKGLVRT